MKTGVLNKVSMLLATALVASPMLLMASTKDYKGDLVKQVRHELLMLPYYSIFDNFSYRVDGSVVTLYGQVIEPVRRSDAVNAVKHIEGVTRVVDNIEVLPLSPMDNQIRWAEARAIYGYPALSRYAMGALPPIHIIVKNGHVTLMGVVANQFDKNVAGIRANGVPNVFSVTNDLQVEKKGERVSSSVPLGRSQAGVSHTPPEMYMLDGSGLLTPGRAAVFFDSRGHGDKP